MLNVEIAVPPDGTETTAGLRLDVEPGADEAERLTDPVKPLTLVTLMNEVPQEPCEMLRLCGAAESAKSGPEDVVVKDTVTDCVRLPLVP